MFQFPNCKTLYFMTFVVVICINDIFVTTVVGLTLTVTVYIGIILLLLLLLTFRLALW